MAETDKAKRGRRLRIIGGTLDQVEAQLDELLEEYSAVNFSFVPVDGELRACVVLISNRVLTAQRLSQGANAGFLR